VRRTLGIIVGTDDNPLEYRNAITSWFLPKKSLFAEMRKIATQYEIKLVPLSLDMVLANSGLDSLC
jgi:hypothetical protein